MAVLPFPSPIVFFVLLCEITKKNYHPNKMNCDLKNHVNGISNVQI